MSEQAGTPGLRLAVVVSRCRGLAGRLALLAASLAVRVDRLPP